MNNYMIEINFSSLGKLLVTIIKDKINMTLAIIKFIFNLLIEKNN